MKTIGFEWGVYSSNENYSDSTDEFFSNLEEAIKYVNELYKTNENIYISLYRYNIEDINEKVYLLRLNKISK